VDLDLHKVRYWRAAERLHVAQPVLTRRTRVDQ